MSLGTETLGAPATDEPEGIPQRTETLLPAGNPYRFAMALPDIAANLGISVQDAALLEKRAIIKAEVWARRNGYRLQELLGAGCRRPYRQDSGSASRTTAR